MANPKKTSEKATEPKASSAEAPTGEAQVMYSKIEPLNVAMHGGLMLQPSPTKFKFAAGLNSIPLAAIEVPNAASFYPVVFGMSGSDHAAFAITGTKAGENRFVSEDGSWRADCYVPAYVRRYPFILMSDPDKDTLSLAADMNSDMFSTTTGEALYIEGAASKAAQFAMGFCTSFRRELIATAEIIKSIEDAGLLTARRAEVTLPGGETSVLTGFNVVDEAKLQALDDATFLSLRKSGALVVIYSHLWSMREWKNLLA